LDPILKKPRMLKQEPTWKKFITEQQLPIRTPECMLKLLPQQAK
jgi:hypothetical protein